MPVLILSHRGFWQTTDEKNTERAFLRSFKAGFGTETDVRDCAGKLMISHDPPSAEALTFRKFLHGYKEAAKTPLPLALNIKADGLYGLIAQEFVEAPATDYFLFDMAVPDLVVGLRSGLRCFTRQSDYEPHAACYERAAGIWLDAFEKEVWNRQTIVEHLSRGKDVCVVSPELHGRPHLDIWQTLKDFPEVPGARLMICTDFPQRAEDFFHGR